MFCTKCGKEIQTGDRFCASCGCEVRTAKPTTSDEIVFNPPFREEAKRKTEEMKSSFVGFKSAELKEEPARKRQDAVAFDWGMETKGPRKVDNSGFDWSGVVEQRKRQRNMGLEMPTTRQPKKEAVEPEVVPQAPQVQIVGFAQPAATICFEREEVPMSIEDLEREIFGESGGIAHKEKPIMDTLEAFAAELETELEEATSSFEPITTEQIKEDSFRKKNSETASLSNGSELSSLSNDSELSYLSNGSESSPLANESQPSPLEENTPSEISFVPAFQREEKQEVSGEENTEEVKEEKSQFLEEKFYTFNQKCDAFDELIKREKEHLEGLGVDIPSGDEKGQKPVQAAPEKLSFEPEKTIVADAVLFGKKGEDTKPEEGSTENSRETEETKEETSKKLRYSDVFPRVEVDENGNPVKNAENYSPVPDMLVKHDPVVPKIIERNKQLKEEGKATASSATVYNKRPEKPKDEVRKDLTGIFDKIDIEEDAPKKRHILSKLIILVLVLMLLCEGVILGTKFIAPDSSFSLWVNDKVVRAIALVEGIMNKDKGDNPSSESVANSSEMQIIIAEASADVKKIGEVTYNPSIVYEDLSSYVFNEVNEASEFVDEEWFEDKNGDMKTYGQVLMSAVVKYFEGWNDINKDENLLGINKLEIGETKIGDTGFYTLVRVTYATKSGEELESYQTVYTGVSDQSIVINMVKEETI